MDFAGRGNEKDWQLGMGMGFAVRTEWEWQNTEWGSLPLTVLIGSIYIYIYIYIKNILVRCPCVAMVSIYRIGRPCLNEIVVQPPFW
jgi:hypothetical protein